MSIRKNTANRLTLFRECYACGQRIITTADTPFMRQMTNVNGKKQATVYFCSESCKQSSYKQREKTGRRSRDRTEWRKQYYARNKEKEKAYSKARYWADPEAAREANRHARKKRKLIQGVSI